MADESGNIVDFQRARGIAEAERLYEQADAGMYRGDYDHLIDHSGSLDFDAIDRDALAAHDIVMRELRQSRVPANNAVDTPVERGRGLAANDNG